MGNATSFLEFDIADRLKEIKVPTLIVHGENDIVSPLDPCGKYLAEKLPNSKFIVFKNVNHCPHYEKSAKFNRILDGFLREELKW
jgi:pimeloyl-ACP methyl ester carboxylesterase